MRAGATWIPTQPKDYVPEGTHDNSVPLDTIERAIKRGTGELEGVNYEQVNYEGYAPHGVAMFVDVLTDNRNRTGAEIRSVFSRAGGSLAEPGAVAWQFERKGVVGAWNC